MSQSIEKVRTKRNKQYEVNLEPGRSASFCLVQPMKKGGILGSGVVVCLPKSRWGINMKSQRKYLLLGKKNPLTRPS